MHWLTRVLLRLMTRSMLREDIAAIRRREARQTRWNRPPRGVRITPAVDAPLPGEWVEPPTPRDGVMLYVHGGGYVVGNPRTHCVLTGGLAQTARMRLFALDYRLAPEHPFPAALDDTVATLQWLAAQGARPLWLAGDSAGGGLVVAALVRARDEGAAPVAGAVLFSPWVDATLSGASLRERARRDPILTPAFLERCARAYAGDTPRDHPLISPLFADLGGLPPLLIHVGTEEILFDDAARLAQKVQQAGGTACLRVWQGMPHVFPLFPFFAESRRALVESARFVWETVGGADARTSPV